jgi:hypothetical protein
MNVGFQPYTILGIVKIILNTLIMKRLLAVCTFTLLIQFSQAQTFPVSGATWIFELGPALWIDQYAEKWEYVGDSVAADGVYKKMRVTAKAVNGWMNPGVTVTDTSYSWLKYAGDTVWTVSSDGQQFTVANFGLNVGDSIHSPYYYDWNLTLYHPDCPEEDSLLLFRKGVVTATGTETVEGITSRYYDLEFLNQYEVPVTLTERFSERSVVTGGYWHWIFGMFCYTITEASSMNLVCYYDDSSTTVCPEEYWFEHLGVDNYALSWGGVVFPNPATKALHITNPGPEDIPAYVTDLNGKTVLTNLVLKADGIVLIDVSGLKHGMYVVNMVVPDGTLRKKFIVE